MAKRKSNQSLIEVLRVLLANAKVIIDSSGKATFHGLPALVLVLLLVLAIPYGIGMIRDRTGPDDLRIAEMNAQKKMMNSNFEPDDDPPIPAGRALRRRLAPDERQLNAQQGVGGRYRYVWREYR